jgi:hypothetical protein
VLLYDGISERALLLLLQLTTYIQRRTAADCTTWQ